MNYSISVLFRAIPLAMAIFCFGLGSFVYKATSDENSITAGLVVIFLGVVCLSLFATAATIIRQLIHKFNRLDLIFYPVLGYGLALYTLIYGIILGGSAPQYFVPGHIIIGLGLITACVSTVATASSRFRLIPENSAKPDHEPHPNRFGHTATIIFYAIPILISLGSWILTVRLLTNASDPKYLVAGSVLGGISAICTALISLVASIIRQESNKYYIRDKKTWYPSVLILGTFVIIWGLIDIWVLADEPTRFLGWVLIGLGLICYSISSKVILLAKVWKGEFALSNRIPLIPILTALTALFISSFLYEWSIIDSAYFVPARVIAGFGAVCFTLFSIVSILESGTSKK